VFGITLHLESEVELCCCMTAAVEATAAASSEGLSGGERTCVYMSVH
jgi:hypothetical protein